MASLVSIVIPCYNVEECVGRAVQSALDQTLPPQEIVCVNDGSTDSTLEELRNLEARNPGRVHVLDISNGGAPAARNLGMEASGGTFVQFLDADDVIDAGKLEAQVDMAQRGQSDLVVGGYRHVRLNGTADEWLPGQGSHWVNLIRRTLGITSANLWRRSAVERAGGWNEDWPSSQESELMFRLLKTEARLTYDPSVRTTVHARAGSISTVFDGPVRNRYVRLRVEVLRHLEASPMSGAVLGEARVAVFDAIRGLYPFDPEAAVQYHRQAIPAGFVPPSGGSNTRPYVLAYRTLGFQGAETVRTFLGRR